jgi:hypothetical protein
VSQGTFILHVKTGAHALTTLSISDKNFYLSASGTLFRMLRIQSGMCRRAITESFGFQKTYSHPIEPGSLSLSNYSSEEAYAVSASPLRHSIQIADLSFGMKQRRFQ